MSTALVVVGVLLGAALTLLPSAAQAVAGTSRVTPSGVYLVSLTERPAATYAGGRPGLPATAPPPGRRFDRTTDAASAYAAHLHDGQDRVLSRIGDPEVLYRYTTVLDGFAARLTPDQVKLLAGLPSVAAVERSSVQHLDAVPLPRIRSAGGPASTRVGGLQRTDGIWAAEGGPDRAGRGTVVGVVDSGIWPENPSFAGLPVDLAPLRGFHGSCAPAEQWSSNDCNDKVVTARWFVRGFGAGSVAASEYLSARDAAGHGSHAASVAAGAHAVPVRVGGQRFGLLSGMAPAARIAVYKACWTAPDPEHDGCTTADTVAAVDAAVADGVDVLSYAVSGGSDPRDTVSRAFLNAASAGVFVATAAGNDGDAAGSVQHVAPWVTTVGASTQRLFGGAVRLGDGTVLDGAMVSSRAVTATRLVRGRDVAAVGSSARQAGLCEIGALDAEHVDGRIVVCERGVTARVDKSTAVARAGGAGMVLVNTRPGSVDADVHEVPTVHLPVSAAPALTAYLRKAGDRASASLLPRGETTVAVPTVARFSSRGPAREAGILKPDLTGPGVSVLGAVSPRGDDQRRWDLTSGTSASAPQVAGLAADVLGMHPAWGPARVKSALMTTAQRLAVGDGPFAGGAGHVDPASAPDPGLVLDAGPAAWRRYLDRSVSARELNLPAVAVDRLVGRATVVRRVTNVGGRAETYRPVVTGLSEVGAVARPARLTVQPGQTRTVRLSFTVGSSATLDVWTRGALTLLGSRHEVRLPVVVRPHAVAAPRAVTGTGDTGTTVVRGRRGTPAPVRVRSSGLVPAAPIGLTLVPGSFDVKAPTPDADTEATPVTVPSGTELARFEIDSHNVGDDVDLYVYRGDTLVARSTSPSADAVVTLDRPDAGDYTVYVNSRNAGNDATTTGQLYSWVVPESGGEPLDLTPSAAGAQDFRYKASWKGLDPTKRYLGVLTYADSPDNTLVEIQEPEPTE